jgi:hypothetical protein
MTDKKQSKPKDLAPTPSGYTFGETQTGLAKASRRTAKVASPKDQQSGSK